MLLISVRCPGHASGVSLADVTAAVIRGAAADRRLRVTLSRREQSMQCDSRQVRLVRPNALVYINFKYKVLPYSFPSVGPGADPGVQAQPAHDLKPYTRRYRLPLLSARPAVTFPAERRHRPSAGTKLYCFTEAHACEQLAQGCCLEADRPRFEPATFRIASERSIVKLHKPLNIKLKVKFSEYRKSKKNGY